MSTTTMIAGSEHHHLRHCCRGSGARQRSEATFRRLEQGLVQVGLKDDEHRDGRPERVEVSFAEPPSKGDAPDPDPLPSATSGQLAGTSPTLGGESFGSDHR